MNMLNNALSELLKNESLRIKQSTNEVRLVVAGGEIVFYNFANGGGEWYFNDTAD